MDKILVLKVEKFPRDEVTHFPGLTSVNELIRISRVTSD